MVYNNMRKVFYMAKKKKSEDESSERRTHCKRCGKKLSQYNQTGECFCHSPIAGFPSFDQAVRCGSSQVQARPAHL